MMSQIVGYPGQVMISQIEGYCGQVMMSQNNMDEGSNCSKFCFFILGVKIFLLPREEFSARFVEHSFT